MSIYDDARHNLSLVAAVAVTSVGVAWALFEGYAKVSGLDRVPANTYVLLKDLRDTHILRTDCERALNSSVPAAQLEACSTNLQSWQRGLAQWKQATETCQANNAIIGEIQRLELQKTVIQDNVMRFSSPNTWGNPSDGISKNNQVRLENAQQALQALDLRILEVTKRLACGQ